MLQDPSVSAAAPHGRRPTGAPGDAALLVAALACVVLVSSATAAAPTARTVISLAGSWHFALDPLACGEQHGWHRPPADWDGAKPAPARGWDSVEAPHNWTSDPRYQYFGAAWYRKSFEVPTAEGEVRRRLRFGAVYQRCRVFVNGALVGAHEGGFTPFELDVTQHVEPGRHNLLAVEATNTWSLKTIPGARPASLPRSQLFPWWPSGGILRDVELIAHHPLYIAAQRIIATPNFEEGVVEFEIAVRARNESNSPAQPRLVVSIADTETPDKPLVELETRFDLPAGAATERRLAVAAPLADVELWGLDRPEFYASAAALALGEQTVDQHVERFGVRSFEINGSRILLNNEPIRLGGANRPFDHPAGGAVDRPAVVAADGALLKGASLEFSRLQHQPLSEAMLDWADEHGLLVIQEALCWGYGEGRLRDPDIRRKYKVQAREMVESSWNHPCIVGWSVGNEYRSWEPAGVEWTREMCGFLRDEVGVRRPIVFVALGGAGRQALEQHAAGGIDKSSFGFEYADITCMNWYGDTDALGDILDALHAAWPDRPILLTEFGKRADKASEAERAAHLRSALKIVRARDYVAGLSYWSLNDYRSMYPGANPNGLRPWGLTTYDRAPRELYGVVQREFAPATLAATRANGRIKCVLTGRADFPARVMRDLRVEVRRGSTLVSQAAVSEIAPGQTHELEMDAAAAPDDAALQVSIINSAGLPIVAQTVR